MEGGNVENAGCNFRPGHYIPVDNEESL